MRIDELKRIAEKNDYEFRESLEYEAISLARKISLDGLISNHISISLNAENQVFIENRHCDKKDINVIKAAIELVETPPEDREEEKKFYLEHKWENKKFTRKEIEEIKEKFDISWKDFAVVEEKDKENRPNWMTRWLGEPVRDCEVEVEE